MSAASDRRRDATAASKPEHDNVEACEEADCGFWSYSRLAVEFHHLDEHEAPEVDG